MGHCKYLLLHAILLSAAEAFPVAEITMTQATLTALQTGPPNPTKDALATLQVIPGLQKYFEASNVLEVSPEDVGTLHATLPNEVVDGSCSHKVTAESPEVTGSLLNSSYFKWGLTNISWHGATVFAETEVDSTMQVDSNIQVKLGKSLFHHCLKIAQKTVGVDIKTNGTPPPEHRLSQSLQYLDQLLCCLVLAKLLAGFFLQ